MAVTGRLYGIHTAVGNFIYIHSPRTAWICGSRMTVTPVTFEMQREAALATYWKQMGRGGVHLKRHP